MLASTTLIATGVALPTTAHAQAARAHDIPAGPLASALNRLADTAGIRLFYDSALTNGLSSSGLKGRFGAAEALSKLLAGTGLTFRQTGADAFTIEPAPQAASGAIQLGPVRVEGTGADSAASGTPALQQDGSAARGYRSDLVTAVGPWKGRSLQDTPYSVTVISRELLENLQATSPDQVYRVAPTVQLVRAQRENNQSTVNMRGFNVVTAYRDGLQGISIYGHGTTTEDAERVEIFTGLSGFMYGPGNVGGVINYISKRPTTERLNRITLGNTGGRNYYVHGDLGGPIDSEGRLGYRLNGVWQGGDTAIKRQNIRKRFISGAFDWHLAETLLWQFNASYNHYEIRGGVTAWILTPGTLRPSAKDIDSSRSYGQPWTRAYYKTRRLSTQLQWDLNDTITLRAAWQDEKTRRAVNIAANLLNPNSTYTQVIVDPYGPGSNDSDEYSTRSGHAFADFEFDTGTIAHKLTAGIQYQNFELLTAETAPAIVYPNLPLSRPTYFARPVLARFDRGPSNIYNEYTYRTLLLGDDIAFSPHWSLLAGLAYSTIETEDTFYLPDAGYKKSAATPNVSLLYKPIETVTIYSTYVEALEQGGVAADDFAGLPVANAGQVFPPLISEQIEVGAKATIGGMLLTGALFQIDKGLQYYDISNPASVRFVQDGRQVHRGIELTAFGNLTQELTLTTGVTLLDAKVKKQRDNPALEGKKPIDVAETNIKVRAEYRPSFVPGLSLSGSLIYTGSRYGDALNTDRLPAYTLFDIGARYQIDIARHPLTLRLDVQNVTDKAYWSQGRSLGDPRAIVFSVSSQF